MFFLLPYVAGALLVVLLAMLAIRWARRHRTPWLVLAGRRLGAASAARKSAAPRPLSLAARLGGFEGRRRARSSGPREPDSPSRGRSDPASAKRGRSWRRPPGR